MKTLQLSPEQVRSLSWTGIVVLFIITGTIILAFDSLFPTSDTIQLSAGDVAQEDILAPYDLSYTSQILLEERRQRARDTAPIRYIDLENVRDQQRDTMNAILMYVDLVRSNPYYASQELQIADLSAITALSAISESRWRSILQYSDEDWQQIATEIRQLLDRTIERRIITEADVQDEISNLDIRGSFSQQEDLIITAIVSQMIVPTEAIDEELTRIAQENAAAAIAESDAQVSFETNDPIVFRRDTVTPQQIEALRQYNLLYQSDRVEEHVAGAVLAMLLVTLIGGLYFRRFYPDMLNDYPMLAMLSFLFIEFLFLARLFISTANFFPVAALVFPAAALALLYMALAGPHLATVGTVGITVLVGLLLQDGNAIEFAMIIAAGSFASILAMNNQERTSDYFYAAFIIAMANFLMYGAIVLMREDNPNVVDLLSGSALALVGGIFAAGIAFVQLGVISTAMNLPTSIRLIDLMRPDQPALKQLLREAPGTFQHSLQVANLSELAAERIDANTTLVRVAAMYHDIGKTLNPYFFVENQKGFNPHETIDDPRRSARILISHVTEGDRMARRFRLPRRIRDFIREHHGTSKPYFYYKALENAGGDESLVDASEYTYPGPIPQSKETGILKLADSIESAARSIQPSNREEVTGVVDMIFQKELQDGQLDESTLTLNDLKHIREVFIDTLEGIYHTRIKYPGQDKTEKKIEQPAVKALEEGKKETSVAPVQSAPVIEEAPSTSASNQKRKTSEQPPSAPQRDKAKPAQSPKRKTTESPEFSPIDDDMMADELTQELPPVKQNIGTKPEDDAEKSAKAMKPATEAAKVDTEATAPQEIPNSLEAAETKTDENPKPSALTNEGQNQKTQGQGEDKQNDRPSDS